MRRTEIPEHEEYKSTLRFGSSKTPYGLIASLSNGDWRHNSFNKQWLLVGEEWWDGIHNYRLRL